MRLSDLVASVASSTQAAVREWTIEHGRQRGLELFARRIGITDRRARTLLEGTAGRIDAAEYIAAQKARAEILRQRIARAQLNLKEIEANHEVDLGLPRRGPAEGRRRGNGRNGSGREGGPVVPEEGRRSREAIHAAVIPGLLVDQ